MERLARINFQVKGCLKFALRHNAIGHKGWNSQFSKPNCKAQHGYARKTKPFLSKPIVNLDHNQALRRVPVQQSINHLIDDSDKLDCVGRSRLDAHEAEYIPHSGTSLETSSTKKT
jgi:hypothetical protein